MPLLLLSVEQVWFSLTSMTSDGDHSSKVGFPKRKINKSKNSWTNWLKNGLPNYSSKNNIWKINSRNTFHHFKSALWSLLQSYWIALSMEMPKLLISTFKIKHKLIGVHYKNGSLFVWFGHSVEPLIKQVEKHLIW